MQSLINYLEKNKGNKEPDARHSYLLDQIIENFHSLTKDYPNKCYREVGMVNRHIALGAIDLVAISSSGEIYLVEGKVIRSKSKDIGNVKHEINTQLKRAYNFFRENFGVCPFLLGVYTPPRSNRLKHFFVKRPIEDLSFTNSIIEF